MDTGQYRPTIVVEDEQSTTVEAGVSSILTTASALPNRPCSEAVVQAAAANTGVVLIGGSTAQAIELPAGASMTLTVSNLNLLYAKSVTGTNQINWMVRN